MSHYEDIVGCPVEQSRLDEITARTDQVAQQLNHDSEELRKETEALIRVDFDVRWETVDISFDIPELRMQTRQIAFNAPKTYRRRETIKFDVPELTWEIKVIGYYPKCKGLKCRKEPIKTKVPVWRKKRVDVSFDLPEFRWDRTSFKMDVPEFRSKRVTWKFDLPRFDLNSISIGGVPVLVNKEKAAELERRGLELEASLKTEINEAVGALNRCLNLKLLEQRDQVDRDFLDAITALEALRNFVAGQQGDMRSLTDSAGQALDIEEQLQNLREQHRSALEAIDTQLALTGDSAFPTLNDMGAEVTQS